ncbi:phospholipase D-like domain-containing protein [Deinococcus radiodurans]|uniref:Phospholipase D-like domain-containing protein n=1 Tax=Deinococcus radiodurans (strain ATCC 13939 / DSM 20539 / JCM 16871 / CCUG 27074 / LMG 4051 / NBRC 15346 / NCIMB 9279 / VKM B-1422 / R1) TaxID=243230 RepID=Q9RWK3_DEIRA|nr:phospholipase D-like domain-containing protein [Deinococcus radiodurans]AAF10246.1 hypothetical protein DR_0663 [Deinococcus radiodurans R1 = ATCC 13939 = DSM 20539]QEM72607.1 hypothetical protein DXG80_13075 [Deinococcus radiodurans]QIP32472.1 hypothetical protein HAV35_10550 [Deinococcus radiodurans]UDK99838.1 hypothetical protein E5E91_03470 [Deinococcus radiodurans R1 = ATCC 13939 = DSM 20539]HCE65321.1 hypothetical protein [Deinococcus radiodurans]
MRLGRHGIREVINFLQTCNTNGNLPDKIFIVSPYYTHAAGNKLLVSLINKGVKVSVLIQSEAWDNGSPSINQKLIIDLNNAVGKSIVKKCDDLHAKIFIFSYPDGSRETWIGSSNFTFKADGKIYYNSRKNIETIEKIVIDSQIEAELRQMWKSGVFV